MTWIFAYGSLIWRPGFVFRERIPALLEGYHRAFCRYSLRHRGTPERPGLVVGLREGGQCRGIAYSVPPKGEAAALAYLDEREGEGYLRTRLPLILEGNGGPRTVPAWSYIPNPGHPSYFGQESRDRLVELVATGRGESGTALDYLRELIAQLEDLRVDEPELQAVLAAAMRYRDNNGAGGKPGP